MMRTWVNRLGIRFTECVVCCGPALYENHPYVLCEQCDSSRDWLGPVEDTERQRREDDGR